MQSPLTHQPRMLLTCWLLSGGIDNMCQHQRECAAPQADLPNITHLHTQKVYLRSMRRCGFRIQTANQWSANQETGTAAYCGGKAVVDPGYLADATVSSAA